MVTDAQPPAGRKRVLVVDDERALLPLLERYLKKLGYEPSCFHDPESALEAFGAAERAFDLVMTDLTLEGVCGEELAKRVLAADPVICVVVMSGYPYSTENFSEADRARVTFLQKPFLPQQFLAAVDRFAVPPAVEESRPGDGVPEQVLAQKANPETVDEQAAVTATTAAELSRAESQGGDAVVADAAAADAVISEAVISDAVTDNEAVRPAQPLPGSETIDKAD